MVVTARGVGLAYGDRRALDGLDIEVPAGSVFGLLGPNGSGKSTFLTLLAAMEPPPEGEILVFGEEVRPALRARVGTVFQENTLDPAMGVSAALRLCARLFGVQGGSAAGARLLEELGLAARGGDAVGALSGGMRRRLEVGRALLHDPELLLLDEPTTGVDPDERRALWAALLRARGGRTILLATNDLAEADQVCDQVAFIRDGRVVASGTPEELKRGLGRESVRLDWPGVTEDELELAARWPGSHSVSREGDRIQLTVDDAGAVVPKLFEIGRGRIHQVQIEVASLEDAYFLHVGSRVREGEAAR